MGLVTVFFPAMMTGAGELVLQTAGGTRLAADCNVYPVESNPATLVGQDKMTLVPEGVIVSCGARERLNTEKGQTRVSTHLGSFSLAFLQRCNLAFRCFQLPACRRFANGRFAYV